MKTIILAGGLGTRISEQTGDRPKPMVEIGGKPLLWHLMNIYATNGYDEFIIAGGYKVEVIKRWFYNLRVEEEDFFLNPTGDHKIPEWQSKYDNKSWLQNCSISIIDTGPNTTTAGRIKYLEPLIQRQPFMVAYGDSLANVDVSKIAQHHQECNRIGTLTAVYPPPRYGKITVDKTNFAITSFVEKPVDEVRINGGFYVFEPEVFEHIEPSKTLEEVVASLPMTAYLHDGFWLGCDSQRDYRVLCELWDSGSPPWRIWTNAL